MEIRLTYEIAEKSWAYGTERYELPVAYEVEDRPEIRTEGDFLRYAWEAARKAEEYFEPGEYDPDEVGRVLRVQGEDGLEAYFFLDGRGAPRQEEAR